MRPGDRHMHEVDQVMVVKVAEGMYKPFRSTNGFYLRVGPNSQKMATDKIAEYVERYGRVRFDERIRKDFDGTIDNDLVDQFFNQADIKKPLQSNTHIFQSLGLVKQIDGINYFTNASILFFTTDPTYFLPQAKITCVAYNGTEKVDILDRKDFSLELISSIEAGLAFLRRHLNEASNIKALKREDKLEIPFVALREALVNAVAHRDYLVTGARVLIEIFTDKVIISNPGGLPAGLSEKDFGKSNIIVQKQIKESNIKYSPKELENLINAYKLEHSYIGIIGKTIEPVIKPLGYDWKIGIAVVSSFADYKNKISKSVHYHVENDIPFAENIYRLHSEEFYKLFREARELYDKGVLLELDDWDRDLLEGTTIKSREWRETVDDWWATRLDIPNLTPRYILQHIGTDILRNKFHPDIWVAALERKLYNKSGIVITDCRFTNEIAMVKKFSPDELDIDAESYVEVEALAMSLSGD